MTITPELLLHENYQFSKFLNLFRKKTVSPLYSLSVFEWNSEDNYRGALPVIKKIFPRGAPSYFKVRKLSI